MKEKSSVLNYSLLVTISSTILTAVAPLVAVFVDGLFAGNLIGGDAFNAINLVLPISNLMMVVTLICNMGGSLLAAKALAVDDYALGNKYFTLSLCTSTLMAWMCTLLIFLNIDSISSFLCPSAEGVEYVRDYLSVMLIYFLCLPLATTFNNMVQMEGHPQLTSQIVVVANAVNILLDVILIYFLDYGIKGAAWATAISGILNAVLYIPHFLRGRSKYRLVRIEAKDLRLLKSSIVNGLGFNIFYIMTNLLSFLVNALFAHSLGVESVKLYGVCLQVQSVTFCVVVGVAIGGIAQINMLNGEGDNDAVRLVFKRLTTINLLFYSLLAVVTTAFARYVAQMFGIDSPDALDHCQMPLACFSIFYLCYAFICVHTTISYQLMGHVGAKAVFVFLTGILVYVCMLLFNMYDATYMWLGFPVGGVLALLATISFGYYHHVKDKTLTRFSLISRLPSDVRVDLAIDYECKNLIKVMEQSQVFETICEMPSNVQMRVNLCCMEFIDIMRKKKLSSFAHHFIISMREKEDSFIVTFKMAGPPCTQCLTEKELDNQKGNLLDLSQEEISQLLVNALPEVFSYRYNFGLNISTMKWKIR